MRSSYIDNAEGFLVVIDNKITCCGGQNWADPEFRFKPKYAPWVDALIRFEGPIVRQGIK